MYNEFSKVFTQLQKEPEYSRYQDKLIDDSFQKIKNEMIDEFNNHLITKEIEGGIGSPNISGTLNNITNLYSFIGFETGTDPIEPIRSILLKINYRIIKSNKEASSQVIINIPIAQEIFDVTPMPWAVGRSWAKGIESGISGLGYYLYKNKNSRSGLGLQSQKQIRTGVSFKNTKYISDIINKYNIKFKNIGSTTI